MSKLLALVATSVLMLAACGGGGGGGEVEPSAPSIAVIAYSVGGQLAGLGAGKVVNLAHVDAAGATVQSAALSANGAYALRLPAGTAYSLRVLAQPVAQTCSVANGVGTATADVSNITVSCADNIVPPEAKVIAGSIAGLGAGKTVVLQLTANGVAQEATVNADGSFQFPVAITGTYAITVKTQPAAQGCTVGNAQGMADAAAAITVACSNTAYTLGGSIAGSTGSAVLRNGANGDTVTVSGNGAFTFSQPMLAGTAYAVTVTGAPAGQSCSVANGAGTANADVSGIAVSCTTDVVVVAPPPPPVPSIPANLTMTYGIKSLSIAWGTVTAPVGGGAVSYQLFEDADGAGPAASTQIGGALATGTFTQVITGLLHTRLNAQYRVRACNASGCSALTAAITPDLAQAIGYFKASNTGANDNFGWSVALSADGNTLAVGAFQEDSNATGIGNDEANNTAVNAGAVYVFIRTGAAWTQQAYVKASNTGASDNFGYSVALSSDGSTLAVGAFGEDSNATGIGNDEANNTAVNAGAVYVFIRTGAAWTQQAYVKASNTQAGDIFGYSVALSTDGSTLAVGARGEDSNATGIGNDEANNSAGNAGAVYVFTRTGAAWTQQAYVKASNTGAGDLFGYSVALSSDGSTLAVAALSEDSNATGIGNDEADNTASNAGAVYVFIRTGAAWAQQAYVKASNTGANDQFGYSMALSADGSTLAVGAFLEDSNAIGIGSNQGDNTVTDAGAVYVFTRTGVGAWSQQAYVKASNTGAGDRFGSSVALSADGSTLAVGAVFEGSNATGIAGDQTDNTAASAGAVYLFTRTSTTWSQRAYVKPSNNTGTGGRFGSSVALSADGSTLAVGAEIEASNALGIGGNQTDNSAAGAGAVYIY